MAEERPAKRRRFTSDIEIVTIKVGTDDTDDTDTFKTQADALKKHSPFFKAALDKKWKEGQTLQIDMPGDEPDIIEAYLGWLHDGIVEAPASSNAFDQTFPFLAKLYVLDEELQDSAFCNAVMDTVLKEMDKPQWSSVQLPSPKAVNTLYNGTPDGSPARDLMVDLHVKYFTFEKSDMDDYCGEFLPDMLVAATKAIAYADYKPQFRDRVKWHKPV